MNLTKHNEDIYSNVFDKESDYHHEIFYHKKNICRSMIKSGDLKILDVGCGDGFMIEGLDKKGAKLYGVDISKKAILKAKQKNIKTKCQNVESEKWDYKSNSFDLLIACDIIEHLYDTEFFLKEANRVLKKEGELLISVPNINCYYNRLAVPLGLTPLWIESAPRMTFWPKIGDLGYNTGHIRVFNKKSIIKMLETYGFKIDKIKGVPFKMPKKFFPKKLRFLSNIMQVTELIFSLIPSFSSLILIKAVKKLK